MKYAKYAVVKDIYDIHDIGTLCIFDSSRQLNSLIDRIEFYQARKNNKPIYQYICNAITSSRAYNLIAKQVQIYDYRESEKNKSIYSWAANKYGFSCGCIPKDLTFKEVIENINNISGFFPECSEGLKIDLCIKFAQLMQSTLINCLEYWNKEVNK